MTAGAEEAFEDPMVRDGENVRRSSSRGPEGARGLWTRMVLRQVNDDGGA
jgi:hypothetical protein